MADRDRKNDGLETTQQPDPFLREDRAPKPWLWIVVVIIVLAIGVTFAVTTHHHHAGQNEARQAGPVPTGPSKPAQPAQPTGRTASSTSSGPTTTGQR
jgi:hypothetical protein